MNYYSNIIKSFPLFRSHFSTFNNFSYEIVDLVLLAIHKRKVQMHWLAYYIYLYPAGTFFMSVLCVSCDPSSGSQLHFALLEFRLAY